MAGLQDIGRTLRRMWAGLPACLGLAIMLSGAAQAQSATIRVGHFPNITHAQALVAHHLTRQGKGWFEERLGPGVKIEWFVYNAGPERDGGDLRRLARPHLRRARTRRSTPTPSPRGEEIRVVAGAANGGAALVVQPDRPLEAPADFRGKKIATPQLGNTQDVAARAWLTAGGLQDHADRRRRASCSRPRTPTSSRSSSRSSSTPSGRSSRGSRGSSWRPSGKVLVEEPDAVTTVLVDAASSS